MKRASGSLTYIRRASTRVTDQDVVDVIAAFCQPGIQRVSSAEKDKINGLCGMLQRETLPRNVARELRVTPYERDCEVKGVSSVQRIARVNVTSIATNQRWCELKTVFRLFAGFGRETSAAMDRGTLIHREHELAVHEQAELCIIEDGGASEVFEVDYDESIYGLNRMHEENVRDVPPVGDLSEDYKLVSDRKYENDPESEFDFNINGDAQIVTSGPLILSPPSISSISDETFDMRVAETSFSNSLDTKLSTSSLSEQTLIDTPNTLEEPLEAAVFNAELEKPLGIVHYSSLSTFHSEQSQFIVSMQQIFGRMTKLLCEGKARELRVIGHYHAEQEHLLDIGHPYTGSPEDYITISGIVDQLELEQLSQGALDLYLREATPIPRDDFELWFPRISRLLASWDQELNVSVRELKTSKRSYIANDAIETATHQISIYNRLLRVRDPVSIFTNYALTCLKRGIDIQAPLPPDLVKVLALSNRFIMKDFSNLKKGRSLQVDISGIGIHGEKMTGYALTLSSDDALELQALAGPWTLTPTAAHLIARLAQLHAVIPLSKNLHIDFHISSTECKRFLRTYNDRAAENAIKNGMDLWLGTRDPIPAESPSVCKSCPFQDSCEVGIKLMSY